MLYTTESRRLEELKEAVYSDWKNDVRDELLDNLETAYSVNLADYERSKEHAQTLSDRINELEEKIELLVGQREALEDEIQTYEREFEDIDDKVLSVVNDAMQGGYSCDNKVIREAYNTYKKDIDGYVSCSGVEVSPTNNVDELIKRQVEIAYQCLLSEIEGDVK